MALFSQVEKLLKSKPTLTYEGFGDTEQQRRPLLRGFDFEVERCRLLSTSSLDKIACCLEFLEGIPREPVTIESPRNTDMALYVRDYARIAHGWDIEIRIGPGCALVAALLRGFPTLSSDGHSGSAVHIGVSAHYLVARQKLEPLYLQRPTPFISWLRSFQVNSPHTELSEGRITLYGVATDVWGDTSFPKNADLPTQSKHLRKKLGVEAIQSKLLCLVEDISQDHYDKSGNLHPHSEEYRKELRVDVLEATESMAFALHYLQTFEEMHNQFLQLPPALTPPAITDVEDPPDRADVDPAWRADVLSRDGKTCLVCSKTKNLEAHHVDNYSKFPALRSELSNGATLCKQCHKAYHTTFGYFGTRATFEPWAQTVRHAKTG
jgi:hypothetical protein